MRVRGDLKSRLVGMFVFGIVLLVARPLWCASSGAKAVAAAQTAQQTPIQIHFVAKINGAPFDCTKKYTHVGRTNAVYEPQDFRMYISQISLVRANGAKVPVKLRDDDVWQSKGVALLDFENGAGTCQNGTPQTHTSVTGDVEPHSDYTGLVFAMAVPFELDHQDASAASPPFDQAGLFWGWQAGYKFLTLDGRVDGSHGHSVHIASTGCQMDQPGHVTTCRAPNEVQVELKNFRAEQHVVVADVGALLAQSVLEPTARPKEKGKVHSSMALPNGCMSEPYNSNCLPIFNALGLVFGAPATKPLQQTFFSVE